MAGASEDGESRVQEESVERGGQDPEPTAEPVTVYGDGQVEERLLGLLPVQHVRDEAFLAGGNRGEAELVGEVPLRVVVDEQHPQATDARTGRGADGSRVFRECLGKTGGYRGLADTALLVADDDPAGCVLYPGGVVGQPQDHRLGQPLDVGDATLAAVDLEILVEAFGEVGTE